MIPIYIYIYILYMYIYIYIVLYFAAPCKGLQSRQRSEIVEVLVDYSGIIATR